MRSWGASFLAVVGLSIRGGDGAIAKAAVDTGGFRFGQLLDYRHPMFLPGGAVLTDEGTYRVNFANTSLGVSIGAVTISGANAGGAQTGISGVQVSDATYTSGTVTFQNANGISFGSSGANGISASYTVPAAQTGISGIANKIGRAHV